MLKDEKTHHTDRDMYKKSGPHVTENTPHPRDTRHTIAQARRGFTCPWAWVHAWRVAPHSTGERQAWVEGVATDWRARSPLARELLSEGRINATAAALMRQMAEKDAHARERAPVTT